jgi:hypothetical protein
MTNHPNRNPYLTSRAVFSGDDLFAMEAVPHHLRSARAEMVNGEDETGGWRLRAHRSEYRAALKAVVDAIEIRALRRKIG